MSHPGPDPELARRQPHQLRRGNCIVIDPDTENGLEPSVLGSTRDILYLVGAPPGPWGQPEPQPLRHVSLPFSLAHALAALCESEFYYTFCLRPKRSGGDAAQPRQSRIS